MTSTPPYAEKSSNGAGLEHPADLRLFFAGDGSALWGRGVEVGVEGTKSLRRRCEAASPPTPSSGFLAGKWAWFNYLGPDHVSISIAPATAPMKKDTVIKVTEMRRE